MQILNRFLSNQPGSRTPLGRDGEVTTTPAWCPRNFKSAFRNVNLARAGVTAQVNEPIQAFDLDLCQVQALVLQEVDRQDGCLKRPWRLPGISVFPFNDSIGG